MRFESVRRGSPSDLFWWICSRILWKVDCFCYGLCKFSFFSSKTWGKEKFCYDWKCYDFEMLALGTTLNWMTGVGEYSVSEGFMAKMRGLGTGIGTCLSTIGNFFLVFLGYSGIGVKLSSLWNGDFRNQSVPIMLLGVCFFSNLAVLPNLLIT